MCHPETQRWMVSTKEEGQSLPAHARDPAVPRAQLKSIVLCSMASCPVASCPVASFSVAACSVASHFGASAFVAAFSG